MPFDLETYREVITDLWNNHQLKEEEIVSRLREDYQFSTESVSHIAAAITPVKHRADLCSQASSTSTHA